MRRLQFIELALLLVEATGRRIESVCLMNRDDFTLNAEQDFNNAVVRWRPENENTKHGQDYPLPQSVARHVHALLEERGVLADLPCFPKPYCPMRSVSPDELTVWFGDLEASIALPMLPRGVWHPYRRKWAKERQHLPAKDVMGAGGWKDMKTLWAKERKHLPAKDVMGAGGWKDIKTFMNSYNEPDMETMRLVAEDPGRKRQAAQDASSAPVALRAAAGQMQKARNAFALQAIAVAPPGIEPGLS